MPSQEAKVFISYSRADSDFALKLGKDLRSAGANIWIDRLDVSVSERWDQAIEAALESCASFLVVLSPDSVESQNVMDEVSYALEEKKQIFPVLYMNCKIPFRIRRIQRSDFSKKYDDGFKQLVAAFKLSLPEEELKKTPGKTRPQQKRTTTATPSALSRDAVKKMLAEKGFYDSELNKNGWGFANQFEPVERQGEGLIMDENSGLTWQQSGSEPTTHEEAQAYIEELNNTHYAGYSDWRLPTLEEAVSLMEPNMDANGLYISPLFDETLRWIWTSDKKSVSRAWVVYFSNGYCNVSDVDNVFYVRAVR